MHDDMLASFHLDQVYYTATEVILPLLIAWFSSELFGYKRMNHRDNLIYLNQILSNLSTIITQYV